MQLRAGPLTADVENGDLRGISFRGLEIVQRVYATVRDDRWGTALTVVRRAVAGGGRRGFEVRIEGESVLAGRTAAVWRLRATGTAAGALAADLDWRATATFPCNRIGLCVHHPTATWAGAAWRTQAGGAADAGRLGTSVLPQPVVGGLHLPAVGPFEMLRLERGAAWTSLASLEGPLELEDQRNWGDASYKSYPSPIPAAPRTVHEGEAGRSRVRLAGGVDGRPPAPPAPALRDAGTFPAVAAGRPGLVSAAGKPAGPGVASLRDAIGPIPDDAGELGPFSELNRRRDDLRGAAALAWSLDPQVHATDDRSIMENVAAVRDQLATAAAIVPAAGRHLALDLAHGREDTRRGAAFEAAWLVGVVAHAVGGATSIVVPAPAGMTAEVVARMGGWEGAPAVVLDDPRRRIAGTGVRGADGIHLLLANLTARRVTAPVAGRRLALAPYEVRSVTASA